jgi:hypothetical protein
MPHHFASVGFVSSEFRTELDKAGVADRRPCEQGYIKFKVSKFR